MFQYRVNITFLEELLGTVPADKEIYTRYIRSLAALSPEEEQEEVNTVVEAEKGITGFHTDGHGPFLFDYVVKGFFKDACQMLRRVKGSESAKLKAFKKEIDGLLFIRPRRIYLKLPPGAEMGNLQRPMRAQTAQGERVFLANSNTCPVGTQIEFKLMVLGGNITKAMIKEWLDYGRYRGFGQWRNASYGTFVYDWDKIKPVPVDHGKESEARIDVAPAECSQAI